jgi:two-component system LytT family sensor kinase
MSTSLSPFFSRYKVYYVIAWLAIILMVLVTGYDPDSPVLPQFIGYSIIAVLAIPACYYSARKLIPAYLYRRKIRQFIFLLLLVAGAGALLTTMFGLYIYHLLTGNPIFRSVRYILVLAFQTFYVDAILIAISCIVKIIADRYFMEQQMLEIENEKINTELNFLRSQINPHFLFNVMNTIYFQIDKRNTDARLSVEKLSEMLRYQLYECTTDKIQIQKELHYIKNYVAVQTLRMEKESDIQMFIDDEMPVFMIAPLLILPLVENAFKHVSTLKERGKNTVSIKVHSPVNNTFEVDVTNTYDNTINGQKHLLQSGGLGMQNLKRRLELLYPGKYELIATGEDSIYRTILRLKYDD